MRITNKYGRRIRFKNKSLSVKQKAKVQQIVKKVIKKDQEWKHFRLNQNTATDVAGIIQDCTLVSQGDTDTTRDGDMLQASSLGVRYSLTQNESSHNIVRMIFLQWYPSSVPTVSDILLVTGGLEVLSMYNTDQAPNYKILYDKTHYMNQRFTSASSVVGKSMKLKSFRPKFQYVASTTVGTNHIYMLAISDSAIGGVDPLVKVVTKLNFRDS